MLNTLNVAFLNENTLGHASYLPVFQREFEARPELGVRPFRIDAVPLPSSLRWWGDSTVPLLRRWGLDYWFVRWRLAASRSILNQLRALEKRTPIHAAIVNTQCVGLELAHRSSTLPLFACLDATLRQLESSGWLASSRAGRVFQRPGIAWLKRKESKLFQNAKLVLPWSALAETSLRSDYRLAADKIRILPPSLRDPTPAIRSTPSGRKPQILFVGGDFARKGGDLVLATFQRHFSTRAELHVVTRSPIPSDLPGVVVHRNVTGGSDAWRERWESADVFVFPSQLETFGIVLIEAMAFGVPIVASDAGASRDLLDQGGAGCLLPNLNEDSLALAIDQALTKNAAVLHQIARARERFKNGFDLAMNAERLAQWFHSCSKASGRDQEVAASLE